MFFLQNVKTTWRLATIVAVILTVQRTDALQRTHHFESYF